MEHVVEHADNIMDSKGGWECVSKGEQCHRLQQYTCARPIPLCGDHDAYADKLAQVLAMVLKPRNRMQNTTACKPYRKQSWLQLHSFFEPLVLIF